jgi:3-deoxy-D-manno-octulosonic acid (KDO) 8-phosphate synthase
MLRAPSRNIDALLRQNARAGTLRGFLIKAASMAALGVAAVVAPLVLAMSGPTGAYAAVSQAAGKWGLVPALSKAAVAAGADGLIIEVHNRPEEAVSDGPQSLKPATFAALVVELRAIASAIGRKI